MDKSGCVEVEEVEAVRIAFLLSNAGVEESVAFIEIIKILVKRNADIDIIIASQRKGMQIDRYYLNNAHINVKVLNVNNVEKSKIELLKDVIRRIRLEKVCETIFLVFKKLQFELKKWKYHDDKICAYNYFLTSEMKNYKTDKKYDYIWVIDEVGLLWADWINGHSESPYRIVYHCYELYWEHYLMQRRKKWKDFLQYLLFEEAKKILYKVKLIVVQDSNRWKVLQRYTGVSESVSKVFFPISMEPYVGNEIGNLRKTLNVGKDKKIIFYPTLLAEKRGCIELANMCRFLEKQYITVIHGFASVPGFLNKLYQNISDRSRIIVSNRVFDYHELVKMHQEVWCVFLYYGESDNNDKYIVRYLRCFLLDIVLINQFC